MQGSDDADAIPSADAARTRLAARLRHASMYARVLLAFACFGVGAVLLALALVPVRLVSARRVADARAQRAVSRAFRLFLAGGRAAGLWRIRVEGGERLVEPGRLLIANHPTLIDVVLLIAHVPTVDCVVKASAWRNPALALIVQVAGYLSNDGGDETIEACAARIRDGRSVLLFPEGTRSPANGLQPFQRGAAHVALRTGCVVQPIFIRCTPRALGKEQPLHSYPTRGVDIVVEAGEPGGAWRAERTEQGDEPDGVRVRRLTRAWRDAYHERLGLEPTEPPEPADSPEAGGPVRSA